MPAQVGLYVMPNPGCIAQIEQDSGGMAGRITRIIRSDGVVEIEGLLKGDTSDSQACRNDGDGRELVFVEWAFDGLEKGELEQAQRLTLQIVRFTCLQTYAHHAKTQVDTKCQTGGNS